MTNKYTHVAVERLTQRKIAILAPVFDKRINEFVGDLVDIAWDVAKAKGQVSDTALTTDGEADKRIGTDVVAVPAGEVVA